MKAPSSRQHSKAPARFPADAVYTTTISNLTKRHLAGGAGVQANRARRPFARLNAFAGRPPGPRGPRGVRTKKRPDEWHHEEHEGHEELRSLTLHALHVLHGEKARKSITGSRAKHFQTGVEPFEIGGVARDQAATPASKGPDQ